VRALVRRFGEFTLLPYFGILEGSVQPCLPRSCEKMKPHLTPRQTEIIRLVSLGCTNDEVGAILKISPSTVDNHKTRAMRHGSLWHQQSRANDPLSS